MSLDTMSIDALKRIATMNTIRVDAANDMQRLARDALKARTDFGQLQAGRSKAALLEMLEIEAEVNKLAGGLWSSGGLTYEQVNDLHKILMLLDALGGILTQEVKGMVKAKQGCQEKAKNGGICPLHNLQCGYPDCEKGKANG